MSMSSPHALIKDLSGLLRQSHGLHHSGSKLSRAPGDPNPSVLQSLELLLGSSLSSGDDGSGVAHAAAGGGGHSGDETDDGLVGVAVLRRRRSEKRKANRDALLVF
jgi:hypothetical protein